jgi:hypothetical protein
LEVVARDAAEYERGKKETRAGEKGTGETRSER